MGKQWAWVFVSVLFVFSGSAQAGFDFNYTVTPGTGALAGDNVFAFYARNDQSGEQLGSKKLLVFDIHFKPVSQSLLFDFTDTDGDSLPDANVSGKGMSESNITGTFMRTGPYDLWNAVIVHPSPYLSGGGGNPVAVYTGVTDFEMIGFVQGPSNAPDAITGLGAFYGGAVVPAGVDINVSGLVAAEVGGISGTPAPLPFDVPEGAPPAAGPSFNFSFTAQAPEPGTLSLLVIGGVGLLSRRKRR